MNNIKLPIMIGKLDMSMSMFYDGYENDTNKDNYILGKQFKGVIDKYPPTCEKIGFVNNDGEVSYSIKDVDVAVDVNLLTNPEVASVWSKVKNTQLIETEEQLKIADIYKVKMLEENGHFGERMLLHCSHEQKQIDKSNEMYVGKEYFKFFLYTYAVFIETTADVKTYEEYQEYYGKYVYGLTLKHNDKFLGLTWLEFINHQPENHLEFGTAANLAGARYEEFNTWKKGDTLTITIIAQGHKDIVLTTTLKKAPAIKWSNMWHKKGIKMREKKNAEK